jgi:hypothetical protein
MSDETFYVTMAELLPGLALAGAWEVRYLVGFIAADVITDSWSPPRRRSFEAWVRLQALVIVACPVSIVPCVLALAGFEVSVWPPGALTWILVVCVIVLAIPMIAASVRARTSAAEHHDSQRRNLVTKRQNMSPFASCRPPRVESPLMVALISAQSGSATANASYRRVRPECGRVRTPEWD